jgi:hypothetical protein
MNVPYSVTYNFIFIEAGVMNFYFSMASEQEEYLIAKQ